MADLRQKVRQMRGAADERDKALHLARRTVERLSEEKAQLEAAAAGGAPGMGRTAGLGHGNSGWGCGHALRLCRGREMAGLAGAFSRGGLLPAGTQAYVRKLEGRLLAVRHAAELEARCSQLKAQVGCACRICVLTSPLMHNECTRTLSLLLSLVPPHVERAAGPAGARGARGGGARRCRRGGPPKGAAGCGLP